MPPTPLRVLLPLLLAQPIAELWLHAVTLALAFSSVPLPACQRRTTPSSAQLAYLSLSTFIFPLPDSLAVDFRFSFDMLFLLTWPQRCA